MIKGNIRIDDFMFDNAMDSSNTPHAWDEVCAEYNKLRRQYAAMKGATTKLRNSIPAIRAEARLLAMQGIRHNINKLLNAELDSLIIAPEDV